MRVITFLPSVFVVLVLTSCLSGQESNQPEEVVSTMGRTDLKSGPKALGQNEQLQPTMTVEGLPKDLVCMVNDAYMGKKQLPIKFEGRMYYGCCEMCVKNIMSDRKVRVGLDPVSGQEVDKSNAFIALKEGAIDDEVIYFESEANYKQYIEK